MEGAGFGYGETGAMNQCIVLFFILIYDFFPTNHCVFPESSLMFAIGPSVRFSRLLASIFLLGILNSSSDVCHRSHRPHLCPC